jgi:hypothetical protein
MVLRSRRRRTNSAPGVRCPKGEVGNDDDNIVETRQSKEGETTLTKKIEEEKEGRRRTNCV